MAAHQTLLVAPPSAGGLVGGVTVSSSSGAASTIVSMGGASSGGSGGGGATPVPALPGTPTAAAAAVSVPRRAARCAWFALVVTTLLVMLLTNSLALYTFLRSNNNYNGGGGGGGSNGGNGGAGSGTGNGWQGWMIKVTDSITGGVAPVAGIVLPSPALVAPVPSQVLAPSPVVAPPPPPSPGAAPPPPPPPAAVAPPPPPPVPPGQVVMPGMPSISRSPLPPPVVPDNPQPEPYPHTMPSPSLAADTVLDEELVRDTWLKRDGYSSEALALVPEEQLNEIRRLALFTQALAVAPNPQLPSPATPKRRLIIALSTGHTGTMWLVRVLRCTMQTMRAEHEPKPSLVSFHQVLLHGLPDTFKLRRDEKWPAFLSMMNNATAADGSIYAEISHMFIKSWADLFANWLAEVDPMGERYDVTVVHLRRYLPHVIRSFLTDKSSWHPRTDVKTWSGGEYTLHHRNFALLPPVYEHGEEDSIDEILGYLHDMELQFARFQLQYPHFTYYQVRAEELFTVPGARRVLGDLGLLPAEPRCITILGTARPVNQHVSWKGPELLEVPPEVFVARTLLYQHRYAALGIPMPLMPQLHPVVACNTTATPVAWCPQPLPHLTVGAALDLLAANPVARNFQPVAPFVPRWNGPTPSPSRSPHYTKW